MLKGNGWLVAEGKTIEGEASKPHIPGRGKERNTSYIWGRKVKNNRDTGQNAGGKLLSLLGIVFIKKKLQGIMAFRSCLRERKGTKFMHASIFYIRNLRHYHAAEKRSEQAPFYYPYLFRQANERMKHLLLILRGPVI